MPDIDAIQKALIAQKLDGWLFYDILHRDAIAYRVLALDHAMAKRRWFYMIPAKRKARRESWYTESKRLLSTHCPAKRWYTRRPRSWKRI